MERALNFLAARRPESTELKHALRVAGAHKLKVKPSAVEYGLMIAMDAKQPMRPWPIITGKLLSQAGQEGFLVFDAGEECLALAANTEKGLANGIYELRLRLKSAPKGGSLVHRLQPGLHKPAFPYRDIYSFQSPWRLQHLSMDSFSDEEWRAHLDFMRSLNANRLYVDLWADQYYHPSFPETRDNKPLWEKLRRMFSYARKIGLRTGFYIFPCMVPVSQYLAHPKARAREATNYYGIDMCWTRAKKDILPFNRFLIEYFNDVFDDLVIELEDPGVCLCKDCCDNFANMTLDMVHTYRKLSSGRKDRHVDLCTLHFRDWIEAPGKAKTGVAHPVRNLRKAVFSKLPRDMMIIDVDDATMQIARRYGLKCGYFFFDLDPESGVEDNQVFPRVHLKRIEKQVEVSKARGHKAVQAYRMMPQAQFVADYVLFRKLWDPSLKTVDSLNELGGLLGLDDVQKQFFAESMAALDDWWTTGQLEKLEEAQDKLRRLKSMSQRVTDIQDLVDILAILGRYFVRHRKQVTRDDFYPDKDMVASVYDRIRESRIFQAYTVHQHWVSRSHEIIGQRIRWWFQGMNRELP